MKDSKSRVLILKCWETHIFPFKNITELLLAAVLQTLKGATCLGESLTAAEIFTASNKTGRILLHLLQNFLWREKATAVPSLKNCQKLFNQIYGLCISLLWKMTILRHKLKLLGP